MNKKSSVQKALTVFLSMVLLLALFVSFDITTVSAASAWTPDTAYAPGELVDYGGSTYKCLQAHTSQVGWEPPNVPALWQIQSGTPAPTSTPTATPANWTLKKANLMTQWAYQVDPNNPWPEYPRPQMVRTDWLNLNGVWQYQPGNASDSVPKGRNLSGSILVPYPVESAISGVMQHSERLWYRRTFTVPASWSGKRVIINFGAIDWESEVYINGTSLGIHKGGYDPFSYDITPYLSGTGPQELIVRVYDPTDNGGYPRGKQTLNPGGIMYTPSTGIWQTVWLEPVAQTGIKDIKIVPDLDNSSVKLTVNTSGSVSGVTVAVKVKDNGTVVQAATGNPNSEFRVAVPNPKLWSPDTPFLYDLELSVVQNGTTLDTVGSYFGMRKISMGTVNGVKKILLNNQDVFEMGVLDQGFWPDGLYTAPTDAALRYDLEQEKALGFNMVRKHIKVEPYRWYYWADKLGLLVWQDMPSANSYPAGGVVLPPVDKAQYEAELTRMIQTHWNSPSIIMWVIFNEGQGQFDTERLVQLAANLDPTRMINQASGGGYAGVGNVLDIHSYPPPACPYSNSQVKACGEYGGIGYKIDGHIWKPDAWGYTMVSNADEFANMYDSFANTITSEKTVNGLNAVVYTQTTDVEIEINGMMTYDRIMKPDINKIKASNMKTINKHLYYNYLLPNAQTLTSNWKYTTSNPGSNWYAASFNDSSWASGQAGFGTAGTPGALIGTTWNTGDIWMRKQFTVGTLTAADLSNLYLSLHHDEDCEVYINGVLAATATGYVTNYTLLPIKDAAKNAIVQNGSNVIAVHCHNTTGGQYIDAGLCSYVIRDTPSTITGGFTDNFEDGNNNGWAIYDGKWTLANNNYTVNPGGGYKSVAIGTNFSDFTYEADIKLGPGGNNAGLIFRVTNPGNGTDSYNGYYAGLNLSGSVVLGKAANNWAQLALTNMTVAADTWYHIKVVASGSNIKVYVGDMNTPKINTNDSQFTSGSIGVRTFNTNAGFDNIVASPGAIFYQDANYGGTAVMLSKGNYTLSQLSALGIPNDWMSSLKVLNGCTVEVYENDNFTGTLWKFTADTSYVGAEANDKMTSVKIY